VSRDFRLESFLPFRLDVAATEPSERLSSIYGDAFGLDIPQWRILANLAALGEATAQDVARITRSHKSTISRAVQHLEARGLVARLVSERDRRASRLTLTAEGCDLLRRLLPLALRFEADLLAMLTERERKALEKGLGALERAIEARGVDPARVR
jgi:DNA-binding MarR family transcriptional regulator